MLGGNRFFQLIEVAQDLDATFVVDAADFRRIQPARRPVEKTNAQPLFKAANVLAGQRLRHAEPTGGLGKAAGPDHFGENPHAVEPVHG